MNKFEELSRGNLTVYSLKLEVYDLLYHKTIRIDYASLYRAKDFLDFYFLKVIEAHVAREVCRATR